MINLNLNKTGVNKLLLKFAKIKNFTKDETDKIFGYTASQIAKRAKIDAPYKTGFLRSTINWGKDQKNVFVRAEAKYAPYLEYGTKPHIIKAKNKSTIETMRGPLSQLSGNSINTTLMPIIMPRRIQKN